MRNACFTVSILFSLMACSDAKTSSEVAPELVSPSMYSGMSCRQLRSEAELVKDATPALAAAVDREYKNDKALEAVTWILFWPAIFAMDGNDAEAAQLGRAKGQLEAITRQMKNKGCRM
jgi:hypothetical protein